MTAPASPSKQRPKATATASSRRTRYSVSSSASSSSHSSAGSSPKFVVVILVCLTTTLVSHLNALVVPFTGKPFHYQRHSTISSRRNKNVWPETNGHASISKLSSRRRETDTRLRVVAEPEINVDRTTSIPQDEKKQRNGDKNNVVVSKRTTVSSGNPPRTNKSQESSPSSSSTTTNAQATKTSSASPPPRWPPTNQIGQDDSPRLQKAKILLEQLTAEQQQEELGGSISLMTSSSVASSSSTSKSSRASKMTQQMKTKTGRDRDVKGGDNDSGTDPTALVVPENYWSNGLLDGSDVVTRYAYRRGVKIAEPLVKYDPVAAQKTLFRQPTKWFVRNIQIAGPLGWWAVGVVNDFVFSGGRSGVNTGDDTASKRRRRQRAVQLRNAISGLGPAIIKAGQALASRPDLLPSEYLEELQKLQDDVPRFSNELAFDIVEQELGVQFEDVFELEQDEPVAAASIGQVYKARLKANGDIVAIKIQRPNCEEIIALDLYILRWWSGIYNKLFQLLKRDVNVQSIIDDFGELIYREIDYVAEAANAQRFTELYAGVTDVFVPKIYSDLTTRKVLVMEWVDGFRLTDNESLKQYGLDRSKLVDTLVQCSLRQILENGFFHADPHAGNLLACPDGRLCYLDFGMMSYAERAQRNGFLLAVVHIVNRDWPELVRVYQRLGFIPEDTDVKPIEVALEKALPDVLNADVSELNFRNVVGKLGDIFYTFPFSLPPFYISIIRCLGVLEGLAIQVDPSSRIISEAYPYVASRVLTDPQVDLQEALKRLALTSDGHIRWSRLEGLLDEAQQSAGYDVTAALNLLTDYLISGEGDNVLNDLANQIVEEADALGTDSLSYLVNAVQAVAISDEVSAIKAFRSFQSIINQEKGVEDKVKDFLPEPTKSMMRFGQIITLLDLGSDTDVSKYVPIIRKLAQEPKVQRTANEVVARLGERALSRTLRALFGLPPPKFDGKSNAASTVFEEGMR